MCMKAFTIWKVVIIHQVLNKFHKKVKASKRVVVSNANSILQVLKDDGDKGNELGLYQNRANL